MYVSLIKSKLFKLLMSKNKEILIFKGVKEKMLPIKKKLDALKINGIECFSNMKTLESLKVTDEKA